MLEAEGGTWREEGMENMGPRENGPGKQGRGVFCLFVLLLFLLIFYLSSCYTMSHWLQLYNILIQLLYMLCSPQV